jgi:Fe-S oxidoreductase
MTEFLERELAEKDLNFQPSSNGTVTYQDPCRLGRGTGIYEQPRDLLKRVPETRIVEMAHSRENSICCGTSAWMECSNCSRTVRLERLNEALKTGAKTLITACPKCQIHFTCAQRNAELDLKVEDLYAYLMKSIKEE